jgi:hypothetical protein
MVIIFIPALVMMPHQQAPTAPNNLKPSTGIGNMTLFEVNGIDRDQGSGSDCIPLMKFASPRSRWSEGQREPWTCTWHGQDIRGSVTVVRRPPAGRLSRTKSPPCPLAAMPSDSEHSIA